MSVTSQRFSHPFQLLKVHVHVLLVEEKYKHLLYNSPTIISEHEFFTCSSILTCGFVSKDFVKGTGLKVMTGKKSQAHKNIEHFTTGEKQKSY